MRLSQLLLPFCIIGLGLLCGLKQVAATSKFDLARCYWLIEKYYQMDNDYNPALYQFGAELASEGHRPGMDPVDLVKQRVKNLRTYADGMENDYIRYFRQLHNRQKPMQPTFFPPELMIRIDNKVSKTLLDEAPSDKLMNFVSEKYPQNVDLLNKIVEEMRQHNGPSTYGSFSKQLRSVVRDRFSNYYIPGRLQSLNDEALKKLIFKSDKILDFLIDTIDTEFVGRSLKLAVEPYSETVSSSSRH